MHHGFALIIHTHLVIHLILQKTIKPYKDFHCLELENILKGRTKGNCPIQESCSSSLPLEHKIKSPSHHTQPTYTALTSCKSSTGKIFRPIFHPNPKVFHKKPLSQIPFYVPLFSCTLLPSRVKNPCPPCFYNTTKKDLTEPCSQPPHKPPFFFFLVLWAPLMLRSLLCSGQLRLM